MYGHRRTTLAIERLRKESNPGIVNKKRIYRLMQLSGLKSVIRRNRKPYRITSSSCGRVFIESGIYIRKAK
ncbi:IS3 family transposase [Lysinibacillus sp. G01H]|uniref:IS3 family transposase n=1 Tax=Lysinibacillus sp. G01H TaxID=3026425 RepID=UPI00406CC54E